mmetsp:Transcript_89029/g.181512  ORF Transcript_89029/g.181512 Transcript_89029/m.181512 type:complete len:413 (-) Transcript_89029:657-1895(-)
MISLIRGHVRGARPRCGFPGVFCPGSWLRPECVFVGRRRIVPRGRFFGRSRFFFAVVLVLAVATDVGFGKTLSVLSNRIGVHGVFCSFFRCWLRVCFRNIGFAAFQQRLDALEFLVEFVQGAGRCVDLSGGFILVARVLLRAGVRRGVVLRLVFVGVVALSLCTVVAFDLGFVSSVAIAFVGVCAVVAVIVVQHVAPGGLGGRRESRRRRQRIGVLSAGCVRRGSRDHVVEERLFLVIRILQDVASRTLLRLQPQALPERVLLFSAVCLDVRGLRIRGGRSTGTASGGGIRVGGAAVALRVRVGNGGRRRRVRTVLLAFLRFSAFAVAVFFFVVVVFVRVLLVVVVIELQQESLGLFQSQEALDVVVPDGLSHVAQVLLDLILGSHGAELPDGFLVGQAPGHLFHPIEIGRH